MLEERKEEVENNMHKVPACIIEHLVTYLASEIRQDRLDGIYLIKDTISATTGKSLVRVNNLGGEEECIPEEEITLPARECKSLKALASKNEVINIKDSGETTITVSGDSWEKKLTKPMKKVPDVNAVMENKTKSEYQICINLEELKLVVDSMLKLWKAQGSIPKVPAAIFRVSFNKFEQIEGERADRPIYIEMSDTHIDGCLMPIVPTYPIKKQENNDEN